MATGDQADIVTRLKSLLPNGWFGDSTPILDALLSGIASVLSATYSLTQYAKLQTRIATATDGFLDLIAYDFLGDFPRRTGESDAAYRARIQSELLLERGTRRGVIRALEILTGRTPLVFEPARIQDSGAYDTNTMGYDVAGAYGALDLPYQAFVIAYRSANSGIPNIAGYDAAAGAYDTPSHIRYIDLDEITGVATDADIYAAIDSVKEAGTIIWTQLSN